MFVLVKFKLSEILGDNLFCKMPLADIEGAMDNKFDLICFWGVL